MSQQKVELFYLYHNVDNKTSYSQEKNLTMNIEELDLMEYCNLIENFCDQKIRALLQYSVIQLKSGIKDILEIILSLWKIKLGKIKQ